MANSSNSNWPNWITNPQVKLVSLWNRSNVKLFLLIQKKDMNNRQQKYKLMKYIREVAYFVFVFLQIWILISKTPFFFFQDSIFFFQDSIFFFPYICCNSCIVASFPLSAIFDFIWSTQFNSTQFYSVMVHKINIT